MNAESLVLDRIPDDIKYYKYPCPRCNGHALAVAHETFNGVHIPWKSPQWKERWQSVCLDCKVEITGLVSREEAEKAIRPIVFYDDQGNEWFINSQKQYEPFVWKQQ